MNILSINSAYSGQWSSEHHGVDITYNENVWELVSQFDEVDDTFFSLIDKRDGSSFTLRIEYEEGIHFILDDQIEEYLIENLRKSDQLLKSLGKTYLTLAGHRFRVVDSLFHNSVHGEQTLRIAFIKKVDFAVMLIFAWPHDTELEEEFDFPAKQRVFIDGLNFPESS